MPWRARCYECGQEAPITRPAYETLSSYAESDLGRASASYEAHPRRPTDTRSCASARQDRSAVPDAQGPLDDTW